MFTFLSPGPSIMCDTGYPHDGRADKAYSIPVEPASVRPSVRSHFQT